MFDQDLPQSYPRFLGERKFKIFLEVRKVKRNFSAQLCDAKSRVETRVLMLHFFGLILLS